MSTDVLRICALGLSLLIYQKPELAIMPNSSEVDPTAARARADLTLRVLDYLGTGVGEVGWQYYFCGRGPMPKDSITTELARGTKPIRCTPSLHSDSVRVECDVFSEDDQQRHDVLVANIASALLNWPYAQSSERPHLVHVLLGEHFTTLTVDEFLNWLNEYEIFDRGMYLNSPSDFGSLPGLLKQRAAGGDVVVRFQMGLLTKR